jgi:hypothetical protein
MSLVLITPALKASVETPVPLIALTQLLPPSVVIKIPLAVIRTLCPTSLTSVTVIPSTPVVIALLRLD